MKVTQDKATFKPVVITLETQEEVNNLYGFFDITFGTKVYKADEQKEADIASSIMQLLDDHVAQDE